MQKYVKRDTENMTKDSGGNVIIVCGQLSFVHQKCNHNTACLLRHFLHEKY